MGYAWHMRVSAGQPMASVLRAMHCKCFICTVCLIFVRLIFATWAIGKKVLMPEICISMVSSDDLALSPGLHYVHTREGECLVLTALCMR